MATHGIESMLHHAFMAGYYDGAEYVRHERESPDPDDLNDAWEHYIAYQARELVSEYRHPNGDFNPPEGTSLYEALKLERDDWKMRYRGAMGQIQRTVALARDVNTDVNREVAKRVARETAELRNALDTALERNAELAQLLLELKPKAKQVGRRQSLWSRRPWWLRGRDA